MKKMMMVLTMMMLTVAASAETTWQALVGPARPGHIPASPGTLTLTDDGRLILSAPGEFAGISSQRRAASGVRDFAYASRLIWVFKGGTEEVKGNEKNVRVFRDQETIELPKKAVQEFVKVGPERAVFIITPPAGRDILLSFCVGGPDCDLLNAGGTK
jgi:hypothetical protein